MSTSIFGAAVFFLTGNAQAGLPDHWSEVLSVKDSIKNRVDCNNSSSNYIRAFCEGNVHLKIKTTPGPTLFEEEIGSNSSVFSIDQALEAKEFDFTKQTTSGKDYIKSISQKTELDKTIYTVSNAKTNNKSTMVANVTGIDPDGKISIDGLLYQQVEIAKDLQTPVGVIQYPNTREFNTHFTLYLVPGVKQYVAINPTQAIEVSFGYADSVTNTIDDGEKIISKGLNGLNMSVFEVKEDGPVLVAKMPFAPSNGKIIVNFNQKNQWYTKKTEQDSANSTDNYGEYGTSQEQSVSIDNTPYIPPVIVQEDALIETGSTWEINMTRGKSSDDYILNIKQTNKEIIPMEFADSNMPQVEEKSENNVLNIQAGQSSSLFLANNGKKYFISIGLD